MNSFSQDTGTLMRYHFRIKDLEVENKHLKVKLKEIEEELTLLKAMVFNQQSKAPQKIQLSSKVEVKVSDHVLFDISADTKIYLQRSCRYKVYQLYLTNKQGAFEFYVNFDGSDYDNYLFAKGNFKISSKRQLVTLLNGYHKGSMNMAMTTIGEKDESSIIVINVLGVHSTPHTSSKITAKTYWFVGSLKQELSKDQLQILDRLPAL